MTTTKSDLIQAVAEVNGFPLNRYVEIIEILLELIKTKLAAGEDVLISGFGKFCIKKKRERRRRNPATGEDIRQLQVSVRSVLPVLIRTHPVVVLRLQIYQPLLNC